jgi:ribosome-binding factor A
MRFRGPLRKDRLSSCSEVGPEDGIDPRYKSRRPQGKVANRKALQLCGQVARTLAGCLGACGEECLRDLLVVSVEPAPDSSRLLVTLCAAPSAGRVDVGEVLGALQRARRLLRCEVAGGIHRKKVPELTFCVIE